MPPPAPRKGLAIASLVLGFVSLLTAGGCGVGAFLGLGLGIAALARGRGDATVDPGRDVAWAGVVTSALAILTLFPAVMLLAMLNQAGALPKVGGGDELPEPRAESTRDALLVPAAPPPPPAPAATPTPRPFAEEERSTDEAPTPVKAVRVGGTIKEPTRIRTAAPIYPDLSKQARVQGVVILEATISPQGKVSHVRVLRGIPLLDQAAIDAVKQWEYTPTLLNGVPVPVIMTVTLNFRLQ